MATSDPKARTAAVGAQLPARHVLQHCWGRGDTLPSGEVRRVLLAEEHIPEKVEPTKETLPLETLSIVPVQLFSLKREFLTVTWAWELEVSTLCQKLTKQNMAVRHMYAHLCTVEGEKRSAALHFLYCCPRHLACLSKPTNVTVQAGAGSGLHRCATAMCGRMFAPGQQTKLSSQSNGSEKPGSLRGNTETVAG
jgi:hypothetical protein